MDARSIVLEARLASGLTQRELSRRAGIPQAAISRVEHGLVSPRTETLDRLLRACQRDVEVVQRAGGGLDRTRIRDKLRLSVDDRARQAMIEAKNLNRFAQRGARTSEPSFDPLSVLRTLVGRDVRVVVIGGFAAALRGSPVITSGLDLCYARDGASLERLADALAALRVELDARRLRAGDHLTFSTSAGPLDCLGTPAGTNGYADLDAAATDETVDGLTIRVAALDDLIRMKRAAGRPKDRIALEWLSAVRDELGESGAEP